MYEPEEIIKAQTEYFKKLAADPTGHSKDSRYWDKKANELKYNRSEIEGLNGEILLEEVERAINEAKNNTAPGIDNIPIGLYKIATYVSKELKELMDSAPNNGPKNSYPPHS